MTAVWVAVVTGVFGLITIWVQAKVHRDNRSDHAATSAKVDQLVEHVSDVKADLRDVKADVRDMRVELRDHRDRIAELEDPEGE